MQATRLVVSSLAALALYAGGMIVVSKIARAHGDAQWRQEGAYVDADNVHCCGPMDCHRDMAAKYRESTEGVWVTTGAGDEVLMPRRLVGHGLYPSIDDDWWICIRGGVVKCVFKPTTGG